MLRIIWPPGRCPFREAHAVVGRLVLYCEEQGKSLEDLTVAEFKSFSPVFGDDVYEYITVDKCVEARKVAGADQPR